MIIQYIIFLHMKYSLLTQDRMRIIAGAGIPPKNQILVDRELKTEFELAR